LDQQAETIFRSPLLIVFTLTALGVILIYADNKAKETRALSEMKTSDSIKIGLAQALAIIPGVSRSGITITAGLLSHFTREDAARFSFLMSAPIIAGAGLLKLKDLPCGEITSLPFIVAFLTAAVASYLAIKFLLGYVKTHSYRIFAYYRFFLAALILIVFFLRR
jgi:undecaprenyl-diphosphatase